MSKTIFIDNNMFQIFTIFILFNNIFTFSLISVGTLHILVLRLENTDAPLFKTSILDSDLLGLTLACDVN